MFLGNEVIELRALEPEDIEFLYRWENDMQIWSTGITITPYSRFALRKYIESQPEDLYVSKQLRLMIVLKTEKKVIGTLDMFDFDPYHNRAGIGILIDACFRSKGFGSQALELFIQYAFNYLKLKQLYCNVAEDNVNSLALFQKQGFKISGKLHSWLKSPDGWKVNYIMQLINS